jgi:hypothetical protein
LTSTPDDAGTSMDAVPTRYGDTTFPARSRLDRHARRQRRPLGIRTRDDHPGLRHSLPPRLLAARTRHLDRGQRPRHTAYREDGRTGPHPRLPVQRFLHLPVARRRVRPPRQAVPGLRLERARPTPPQRLRKLGNSLRTDRILRDMPRVHTGTVDHSPAPMALPRMPGTTGERASPPACRPVRPLRREQHPDRTLRDARPG